MTIKTGFKDEICLMIDATEACQLGCRYCYFRNKSSRSMDVKSVFESTQPIISWSRKNHKKESVRFHYMGGEPLLAWDKILDLNRLGREYCDSIGMNFSWSLTSNLIALDEHKTEHMLNEGASIHCSIDGPSSIHNKNRPYAKTNLPSFDDVAKHIPLALQINPSDTARVTVCPEDAKRLREISEFVLELGFKHVGLFPAEGARNEIEWNNDDIESWGIGLEEACAFVKSAYPGKEVLSTLIEGTGISGKRCHDYCGAGKGLWALDVEGRLHFCHRLTHQPSYSLGYGYEFDENDIDTKSSMSNMRPSSDCLPILCKDCDLVPYCNGGCWTANLLENGNSSTPIESSCMLRRVSLPSVKDLTKHSDPANPEMCILGECIICAGHCYVTLCCDPCQTCNICTVR